MRSSPIHRLAGAALALLLGAVATTAAAAQGHVHPGGSGGQHGRLGTLTFPNSGAAAAQPAFLRGMALLHSFEYEDAADAFRQAQATDPKFALAYWGEALTYKHIVWGQENLDSARAVLTRLGATPEARRAAAPTEREKAYLQTVEILFFGEGDKKTREKAYEDALERMHARFPQDDEVAALHALSIIAAQVTTPPDVRRAAWLRAAAMLEPIFRRNPDHPGAAHYLIHAYDDAQLAERGLPAARAYARIAPAAVHALHMPSHIFVQRGEWEDVASSNTAGYAASIAWVARKGLKATYRDWHAYHWLHYAYLQQGRVREAQALLDSARATLTAAEPDSLGSLSKRVLGLLEVQMATDAGRWPTGGADALPPNPGMLLYMLGMGAAHRGDRATLAEAARRGQAFLDTLSQPARGLTWRKITGEMNAYLAKLDGKPDEAVARMRAAAAIDDSVLISGPPTYVPTRELLGDLLMELGRPAEAAAEYDLALQRTPNRSPVLLGRARAAAKLGRAREAADFYARLLANWRAADADSPLLAEVRRGAAGATTASTGTRN